MAQQYTREQLLRLRESPLVVKPATLPPTEEWMGQLPETQRRSDAHVKGPRSDIHAKSTGKSGGDIILGPPRTSFSSSTFKSANGSFDSPGRSAFGNFASENARGDYFPRTKSSGDRLDEAENVQRKSNQYKLSGGDRSLGNFGDTGKPHNNNGNRDRDLEHSGGRDSRKSQLQDLRNRDRPHDAIDSRRNTSGRTNRPPWLREDSADLPIKDGASSREWRGAEKSSKSLHDRDWHRSGFADQEPEWMASETIADEDEKRGHTAQDIEQWKASMRARDRDADLNSSTDASKQHSSSASNTITHKQKGGAPLLVDSSLDDKFFSAFSDKRGPHIPTTSTDGVALTGSKMMAVKPSKFSGFFSPQVAGTPTIPSNPPNMSPPQDQVQTEPGTDTVSEDKAGFQRILAMLAGPQSSAVSQPAHEPQPSQTPPGDAAALQTSRSPPPILSPRSRRPGGLENLLGMQSPPTAHAQPTNKDADFLLHLLRSKDSEGHQDLKMPAEAHHQHLLGGSNVDNRHNVPLEDLNDGSATYEASHSYGHRQRSSLPYREDEERGVYLPQFYGPPPPSSHPPGLQRPPGMEHMPIPPGLQFAPPNPQFDGPGAMGPPPGFPGRPTNSGHFPPGLMSNLGNLNLGNEGGGHFGSMGPGSGSAPGMRMQPPPGFGGMGGPPPRFTSQGGPPPEGYAGPPHGRMPMEMFDAHFGNGGHGIPPGLFRRQE